MLEIGNLTMTQTLEKKQQKEFITYSVQGNECVSHMCKNGFFNIKLPLDTTGKTIRFAGRDGVKDKTEWYKAGIQENGLLIVTYNSHHSTLKAERNYVFKEKSRILPDKKKDWGHREKVIILQRQRILEDEKKEKERLKKAQIARDRFQNDSETGISQYLERKQVGIHGIRFEIKGGETLILIPMSNEKGEIQALQEIYPSKRPFGSDQKFRDKHFTNATKGLFHTIGTITNGQEIRFSEGYATAASCYESTGSITPHVVAFTAGAYQTLIPILKNLYPDSPILICADNNTTDPEKKNIGLEEAKKAASMFGDCSIVYPVFPEGKRVNENGDLYADFNDLMIVLGKDEVKRQIEQIKQDPCVEVKKECLPTQT